MSLLRTGSGIGVLLKTSRFNRPLTIVVEGPSTSSQTSTESPLRSTSGAQASDTPPTSSTSQPTANDPSRYFPSLFLSGEPRIVGEHWYPEIRFYCPKTPIILVGTKMDLEKTVSKKMIDTITKSTSAVAYVPCSALTRGDLTSVQCCHQGCSLPLHN